VLPFDTDDPEFGRGFEVGQMWSSLPGQRSFVVHISNAEMVVRLAEYFGLTARSNELGDLMEVTFE
jgi:hypothetical protein